MISGNRAIRDDQCGHSKQYNFCFWNSDAGAAAADSSADGVCVCADLTASVTAAGKHGVFFSGLEYSS